MRKDKISIHDAAAALLSKIQAPPGSVTTMVDIDERKGEVIRVLVSPTYRHALHGVPTTYMGYPVLVGRQPAVNAFLDGVGS